MIWCFCVCVLLIVWLLAVDQKIGFDECDSIYIHQRIWYMIFQLIFLERKKKQPNTHSCCQPRPSLETIYKCISTERKTHKKRTEREVCPMVCSRLCKVSSPEWVYRRWGCEKKKLNKSSRSLNCHVLLQMTRTADYKLALHSEKLDKFVWIEFQCAHCSGWNMRCISLAEVLRSQQGERGGGNLAKIPDLIEVRPCLY